MKSHWIYACSATALLSGCAAAELTTEQRHMQLSCLNTAEQVTGNDNLWRQRVHTKTHVYDAKVSKLKALCRRMSDQPTETASMNPQELDTLKPSAGAGAVSPLMQECETQLRAVAADRHDAQAVAAMRGICKKMTASSF